MKEFWKLVNIWWRYGQELGVLFFFDSRCISQTASRLVRSFFYGSRLWPRDAYIQTDRQTHRPRYICNNRPHTYEFLSKRSFVVLREVFFERQNDAVSDDREQHHVLERRSHQQALLRIVYTVRFIRYETPFNVRSKADILVKQLNLLHELKNGRICGKFWDGMLSNDFYLLLSPGVQEFWKSISSWRGCWQDYSGAFLLTDFAQFHLQSLVYNSGYD